MFLNAVKGKEGIKHLELKIEDKKRKFIIICNPITDERKKVVGVMLILNEITEELRKTEEIKVVNELLRTLLNVHVIINKPHIEEKILNAVVQEIHRNKYLGCIHLLRIHEKSKELYFYSSTNQRKEEILDFYNDEFIEKVKKKGFVITDISKGKYRQHKERTSSHSAALYPMKIRNKFYGILTIHFRSDVLINKYIIKLVKDLASQVSQMIYKKELEESEKRKIEELKLLKKGFTLSAISRLLVKYENNEPVIMRVNSAFTDLYGYDEREVIGKNPKILKSGLTPLKTYKEMWKSILDKRIGHWEGNIINKDKYGNRISVRLIIDTVFEKGKPPYFFANHINRTKEQELLDEIKKDNEYLRSVFDASVDAIVVGNRNLRFEYVNKAFEKLTGYQLENIKGKDIHSILSIEEYPLKRLNLFKKTGKSPLIGKTVEVNIRTKEENIPIELTMNKFTIGNETKLIAILRDIRQRKSIEEKLKEREELYFNIFENISDGIIVLTPIKNGRYFIIKEINERATEISKVKKEEVIGKNIAKVFPGVKKIGLLKQLRQTLKTGKKTQIKNIYYSDPVRKGWRDYYVFKIKTGDLIIVYRDITKEKEMIDIITESEKRYRTVFQNINDIYFELNDKLNVELITPSIERYGLKTTELIGKNIFDIYSDKKLIKKMISEVKKNGSYHDDIKISLNGKKYDVEILAQGELIKNKLNKVYIMLHDISERKEKENLEQTYRIELEKEVKNKTKELNEKLQQIERLEETKDEFIRNMTHELKTPTSVILTNLEMLKQMAPIGKEKEWLKMIEMLQRSGERLKNSIDQILNLTRLSSVALNKERTIINDLINEIYEEYSPLANKKGIVIKRELEPIVAMIDKNLVSLMLSNLMSNAVKFTDKGEIKIETKSFDHKFMIAVEDTGIGMTEEEKSHIFEKFYKADPNSPGTGIGLTIVKEIVDKHKGEINVKSEKGKGTRFEIILPR
ncbi:MAG: PAS domain S-box protein [Candidatus Micrarchaeia archaeon]